MSCERTHSRVRTAKRYPAQPVKTSIPTATYRLQFHRDFTFAQATAILDYLRALGISHVYSSPYFHAGESSTHGYDVADHNSINPTVGDAGDYAAFISRLRERGMGQVLDFVPNHMGISEPINRWWMDVLENGPSFRARDLLRHRMASAKAGA